MATSKTGQTRVDPCLPPAPWQGGKRNLAGRLVELIERTPHVFYGEPFVGMGGIFFRRRSRPAAEAINDFSRDVATLFRILQRHYPQFMEVLKFQVTSRSEFERLARTNPDTLTDLERSARFIYLQRTSFGGKVVGQTFGVSSQHHARFDITKLGPMLEDIHERLAGVTIERLTWSDFIRRYDRPSALFYLDPPYWGCETDYGDGLFARADFTAMAAQLATIKGRFILSINDRPEIRAIFKDFRIEAVKTTYGIALKKAAKQAARGELVITGPA